MRSPNRKIAAILAVYLSMMVLPMLAFVAGWIGWDVRKGAAAAVVTFAVCFIIGAGYALFSKDVSPWLASIPYFFGLMYALLPDFLPGLLDDIGVSLSGAIFTYFLWLRRLPDAPRWIIFPLLVATLYLPLGGLIPTPADEMIVFTLGAAAAAYGIFFRRRAKSIPVLVQVQMADEESEKAEENTGLEGQVGSQTTEQPIVDAPAQA